MDKLLHPILLSNCELIAIIRDRQLDIINLEALNRDELLNIFKAHIMPKPQRHRNPQSKASDSTDSTNLAQEVKRIKLNREPYSQPVLSHNSSVQRMEVRENQIKRSIEETLTNKSKRQKIQWP